MPQQINLCTQQLVYLQVNDLSDQALTERLNQIEETFNFIQHPTAKQLLLTHIHHIQAHENNCVLLSHLLSSRSLNNSNLWPHPRMVDMDDTPFIELSKTQPQIMHPPYSNLNHPQQSHSHDPVDNQHQQPTTQSIVLPELVLAIKNQDISMIKQLLQSYKPHPLKYTLAIQHMLLISAHLGWYQILSTLVEHEIVGLETWTQHIDDSDAYGFTALHLATLSNQTDTVKYLIETLQANPNHPANYGQTALHAAITTHDDNMAIYLIQKGANPFHMAMYHHHAPDSQQGQSPFLISLVKGQTDIVNLIYQQNPTCLERVVGPNTYPLHVICFHGHAMLLNELYQHPTPQLIDCLSYPDHYGKTPIMLCAEIGHSDCLKICLEHSSFQVHTQTCFMGETALTKAIRFSHAECTELLLKQHHNADNEFSLSTLKYRMNTATLMHTNFNVNIVLLLWKYYFEHHGQNISILVESLEECLRTVQCGIGNQVSYQPVLSESGHGYDLSQLTRWYKQSNHEPQTRLPTTAIYSNPSLAKSLLRFIRFVLQNKQPFIIERSRLLTLTTDNVWVNVGTLFLKPGCHNPIEQFNFVQKQVNSRGKSVEGTIYESYSIFSKALVTSYPEIADHDTGDIMTNPALCVQSGHHRDLKVLPSTDGKLWVCNRPLKEFIIVVINFTLLYGKPPHLEPTPPFNFIALDEKTPHNIVKTSTTTQLKDKTIRYGTLTYHWFIKPTIPSIRRLTLVGLFASPIHTLCRRLTPSR